MVDSAHAFFVGGFMSKLSVETEYDKAVEAVAVSIADCNYRKTWHICSEDKCIHCEMSQYQLNCMNGFADVDKIKVYNRLQELVAAQPVPEDPDEVATGRDAFKLKLQCEWYHFIHGVLPILMIPVWILLLIIVPSILLGKCVQSVYGQSLSDYSHWSLPGEVEYKGKYRKQIIDTLNRTKQYVTDVNNDGEVNCIDYSCTFKMIWDKMYEASDCEIVRNKSGTMNHLFIRTRQFAGKQWECIEPQAAVKDITRYFMEDFWPPDIYNPVYNIYGETEQWLKEVSSD